MSRDDTLVELLRLILENSLQPHRLDSHPWTKSLLVLQACQETPDLSPQSPGQQLVMAVARVFRQMMPSVPPKQGKRLDTRWGEFGILAAQYFSPLLFGEPSPASLRDSWGCIDRSIQLFMFGKDSSAAGAEREAYRLVAAEPSIAPNSTLSDWNRNGLKRLLELILDREHFLAVNLARPAVIDRAVSVENAQAAAGIRKPKKWVGKAIGWTFLALFLLLLGGAAYGYVKGKQIYQTAMLLRQDAANLQQALKGDRSPVEKAAVAGSLLPQFRQDYETLKSQAGPYVWLAPYLKWVPKYGGEIASVEKLIAVVDPMLTAAEITYQAASPLLSENGLDGLNVTDLAAYLVKVQPQLLEAHRQVNLAQAARDDLPLATFSPSVQELIEGKLDPAFAVLQDGFTFAQVFPSLVGASQEGPKTYLLLVENEDELRPTGGFITAVGTLLMQDGRIASMTFENSGDLDDWSQPYPAAPWQLQQYMNSQVLVVRDANWFTNFPTAALYAETLYSYINAHSEDGVIAFDQQALVELLKLTGPVDLADVSYPIDSSNVIAYMRTAKMPTAEDRASPDWNYKLFMKKIADALAAKLLSGDVPLETLITGVQKILNEHHVLIQLDNPYMAVLMAKYHWDGAIRHEEGDFLMAVDSNVGFNKTNAVVEAALDYDVDLTTPLSPLGTFTITHKNNSPEMICKQWDKIRESTEKTYPISDCYWNYMRVYVPKGAELLDSKTQFIPANWMIVKKDIEEHVDLLDEGLANIQAFGTLKVVPGSESVTTVFHYSLPPATLLQPAPNQFVYKLKIQKQPGTDDLPITVRVHLPGSARIVDAPANAVIQNNSLLIKTNLRVDRELKVQFSLP